MRRLDFTPTLHFAAAFDEGNIMRARLNWVWQHMYNLGPYVLVELLLPGGTLLALLLWLSQYRRKAAQSSI